MPSITLKDIPDDLHSRLKEDAAAHGRSLSKEILLRLRVSVLEARPRDPKALIAKAARVRRSLAGAWIDDDLLARSRREGRP